VTVSGKLKNNISYEIHAEQDGIKSDSSVIASFLLFSFLPDQGAFAGLVTI